MRENLKAWIEWVAKQEPELTALVERMGEAPGILTVREKSREVGCLPYILKRVQFPVTTTIRFTLLDHNSDSDVVITNMTTLPAVARGFGHGTSALGFLLEWAAASRFQTVRATQVSSRKAEGFWKKMGFTKLPRPNPCNDFIKEI